MTSINDEIHSIIKKIENKKGLSNREIELIEKNSNNGINSKLILALDKLNKGIGLNPEEINILNQLQQNNNENNSNESFGEPSQQMPINNSPNGLENLIQFKNILKEDSSLKESKIIHITDTHSDHGTLENILDRTLSESEFNPSKDVVVHTGDLLEDFLDINDIAKFSSKWIVDKGKLNTEESNLFKNSYSKFLNYLGINERDIDNLSIDKNEMESLIYSLYGLSNPNFLTNDELEDFNKHRSNVMNLIKQGIKNHAREGYSNIKEVLKRYNLTPDNFVLVAGNHDIPEVMSEVLGEYLINEGTVKELKGVRFGNALNGSNGPVMGPMFGDVYGLKDGLNNSKIKYNTESFKSLLNYLHDRGFTYIDEVKLDQLTQESKKSVKMGIGRGDLSNYFERRIFPEIDHTISKNAKYSIDNLKKNRVDVYLGHGDIGRDDRTGLEEKKFKEFLKGSNAIYLHGHEHANTTRHQEGINLINSGSSLNGNYGVYSLDKNNKIKHLLFNTFDKDSKMNYYNLFDLNQLHNK